MASHLMLLAGLLSSLTPYSAAMVQNVIEKSAEIVQAAQVSDVAETREVWVTAYSSTPEETDDTPFIVASGKHVAKGIMAANFLPFGTRVRIPALFGDEIFVVEDRMHRRKTDFVDIWMPTKQDALNFGITRAVIEILIDKEG